jgi:LmbE family N-acetylglucosaminyl deacetylase
MVFLRLPDGGFPKGTGTTKYGGQSLTLLWRSKQETLSAVDKSNSYKRQDLIDTLSAMMKLFQPRFIAVQDYVHRFGGGDHMDHYAAAKFAHTAHQYYESPHSLVAFAGYQTASLGANVGGAQLAQKQETFYTYGHFDALACTGADSCSETLYAKWLEREYVVGSESADVEEDND